MPSGFDASEHIGHDCPGRLLRDPFIRLAIDVWRYQRQSPGQMPFPGGLLDQPAKLMEALAVLDDTAHLQALAAAERRKAK